MARFRLLVIISAVWLTFIFNLERPDFDFIGLGNIDLDSVMYVIVAGAALASLWLPDLTRRTEYIFLPSLLVYVVLKMTFGNNLASESLPLVVLEIVVIFMTIAVFRRISQVLTSFEQTVDHVLLRPDTLRVLEMEDGMERLKQELTRARRFERHVGLILLSIRVGAEESAIDQTWRFDLEDELQKHYLQLRLAQVAELVLYKVDLIMLYKDDVMVILPETTPDKVGLVAEQLIEEVQWRLNLPAVVGYSVFPEDGFIDRDLIDKATVRLYDAQDAYLQRGRAADDDDEEAGSGTAANGDMTAPQRVSGGGAGVRPAKLSDADHYEEDRSIFAAIDHILNPWPDIISRLQARERYGRRGETDDLFDPTSWLGTLPYQSETSRQLYNSLKRVIDLLLVLLALPLVLPVMLVVALLIWLEDRGPIFFMQERTGFGGQRFRMYKFRTMVPDAEAKLKELAAQGLAKLDANGKLAEPLKLKHDPRITRVGRILRKTSLDELPQLINVLRGDMAIVGPRPTSWGLSSYRLFHTERLRVRPGITGLWQVGARGSTDFNEWVDWDRTYVDKMCISLDVQIFFRTFTKVFQQKGAR